MMTVYCVPVGIYCAKLRILLRYKRLEWRELPPPGGYGTDDYKRIVPSGNVPALDDDGLILGDSEAIAEYLNEKFPAPPMLPDDLAGRARVRELSRFNDTRLEPEVRALFAQTDPATRDPAVVGARAGAISARLSQLAHLLEWFGETDALTLGDCGFPATFEWIDCFDPILDLGIDWPDAVRAYRERLGRIDAVSGELSSYRPVIDDWIARKTAS
mgnify:CR=1 FL=1